MRSGLENKGLLEEPGPKDMQSRIEEVSAQQGDAAGDLLDLAVDLENRKLEAKEVAKARLRDDIQARNILAAPEARATQKEPVINANVISGLLLGLLAAGGYTATEEEIQAVEAFVAVAITSGPVIVNLIAALVARRHTTWIPE